MNTDCKFINFYSRKDEHGYLSNFARYPLVINGKNYKTSEHYYQSQKFAGTEWESKVCEAETPMGAANIGRDPEGPLCKNWLDIRDDVMRFVVMVKFTQHPELAKQLLDTGDAILVEHTDKDSYWADGGDGSGKNMLGVILMETRTKLKI